MVTRTAEARWEGALAGGTGTMRLGSGSFEGRYSFGSRFEGASGTSPEELIAAAEAGCFSMALSKALSDEGHVPRSVHTTARVSLDHNGNGYMIGGIDLELVAEVPEIDEEYLRSKAEETRRTCIVSRALAGVPIAVKTKLLVASH